MATRAPESAAAVPAPVDHRVRLSRGLIGYIVGCFVGGLLGWAIDSALTSEPYAGVRIGLFVGGLTGAMIGGGTGWTGVWMMLCMVVCSAAGALLWLAVWNPGPDSFLMFVPVGLGGMVGALGGLVLAAVVLRSRRTAAGVAADQRGGK